MSAGAPANGGGGVGANDELFVYSDVFKGGEPLEIQLDWLDKGELVQSKWRFMQNFSRFNLRE